MPCRGSAGSSLAIRQVSPSRFQLVGAAAVESRDTHRLGSPFANHDIASEFTAVPFTREKLDDLLIRTSAFEAITAIAPALFDHVDRDNPASVVSHQFDRQGNH